MPISCRRVSSVLSLISSCLFVIQNGSQAQVPIIFQSPQAQSRYVLPQATIILRPAAIVDSQTIHAPGLFSIVGTSTGSHSGVVVLSDDHQTIIFKPDSLFAIAETVNVITSHGLHSEWGEPVDTVAFEFVTTDSIVSSANRSLQEIEQETATPRFSGGQCTIESVADTLPADFPHIVSTVFGTPSPGLLFLAAIPTMGTSSPYIMIVNNDGSPVFYRRVESAPLDFRLQPNGLLTYFDDLHNVFFAMDASYSIVDTFQCQNGYVTDPHDLFLMNNGHTLMMSYDLQRIDMSQIVPGGNPGAIVTGLIVQELDRARNVVFQWRSWDHFQITDATHESLVGERVDYAHGNSVDIDSDGNLLISSRHMDEITKVSRSTGEIIWRLGGRHNQFTFLNDTLGFSYQHAVRRIANGHITLFDNGNYHVPAFSRALEYEVDEVNMTATLIWQYRNVPDIYGFALGYVQRLSTDNTLIGWGATSPTLTEVRPDGSKVLELTFDPGVWTYRVYRFPWNAGPTDISTAEPVSFTLAQNYPNPFNGTTQIRFILAEPSVVTLGIYDVTGREVASLVHNARLGSGIHTMPFDASGLASGVYFYRLQTGAHDMEKKMVLLR